MNWMEFVCDNLPKDWKIQLVMEYGSASVILFNPKGQVVEMLDPKNLNCDRMLLDRVNRARMSDGLEMIEVTGIDNHEWGKHYYGTMP